MYYTTEPIELRAWIMADKDTKGGPMKPPGDKKPGGMNKPPGGTKTGGGKPAGDCKK